MVECFIDSFIDQQYFKKFFYSLLKVKSTVPGVLREVQQ